MCDELLTVMYRCEGMMLWMSMSRIEFCGQLMEEHLCVMNF